MRSPDTSTVSSDALLVGRIAALGDKAALAELDARYGMTLYAAAYGVVLDPGAADTIVAAVFREVWRSAASFVPGRGTVQGWLTELTRRAAQQHAWGTSVPSRNERASARRPAVRRPEVSGGGSVPWRRWMRAMTRLVRVAAVLAFAVLL